MTIPKGGIPISMDFLWPCQAFVEVFMVVFNLPLPPYWVASLLNISVSFPFLGIPIL